MPVNLPDKLPAIEILSKEHIFVMSDLRASTQDIRPLKILILNLMPLKITTETDLIRLLSNSPLQLEIEFLGLKSHTPKNTPIEHLQTFYKTFPKVKESYYDGFIVTGAPVELLPFEEVRYWQELTGIFDCVLHLLGRTSGDVSFLWHPEISAGQENFWSFSTYRQR